MYIALFILGLATGILSAMGVGGGTLMVPALIYFFDTPQIIAQGVIITIFLPTAIIASIKHYKNGYLDWHLSLPLALSALPGGILGAMLAHLLKSNYLSIFFGIFLILASSEEIYTVIKKKRHPH